MSNLPVSWVPEGLRTKLELLPNKPGVYLFKDAAGEVIYVGKAVSLRNRVRSYFRAPRNLATKVLNMMSQVADLEYILTDSEVEALILECNLIKEHRPRFNVRLRDDKNYPYLRITVGEPWPRVVVARGFKNDGSRYFGPFAQVGSIQETIRTLRQVFPFRTCSDARFRQHRSRPCLHYFIKRCPGPCAGLTTPQACREAIEQLIMFLEGRGGQVLERLRREMKEAAAKLEFERAATLRDRLRMLEAVVEKQKVVLTRLGDEDFVALARLQAGIGGDGADVGAKGGDAPEDACAHVFFVREGKLVGREAFLLTQTAAVPDREVMSAFLKQFYGLARDIPPVVNVPFEVDDQEAISDWLTSQRGARVSLRVPRRGERRQLLDLAQRNAKSFLKEEVSRRSQVASRDLDALAELQRVLALPRLPHRIECYDISNTQGRFAVGSMAVFEGGWPAKGEYRSFRIKGVGGPDDFAMIREVLARRLRRYLEAADHRGAGKNGRGRDGQGGGFGRLPDLIIIDGGRGQLSAAASVMDSLGLGSIPLYALAKENEWLFGRHQADPVILPRDSKALKLVQHIRDEAHRFAIGHHRRTRSRSMLRSILDEIPGVGPKRRKTLLEHFPSLDALRNASVDEVASLPGMNRAVAEEILHTLAQQGV